MTSGTSAGFGRRLAALLYDAFLVGALLMVYTAAALIFTRGGDGRPQPILRETVGAWAYVYYAGMVAVITAYSVLNWTRSGQTLGMRAWRLHAVDAAGRRLTLPAALVRFGWAVCAWLPAALGVLWLYFDRDRLALQDRLSNTRVVHLAGA